MPKAGPSNPLPIHTRLGIPSRRHPPPTRHLSSLTKRVFFYDCQTPGHAVHVYVFETHLNGVAIPIDPADDAALLSRVRTPRCPLPARQGVVRQVGRLNGPAELFGGLSAPSPPADMDEDDEMEHCISGIRDFSSALSAIQKRLASAPSFELESEAFWAALTLTSLRARRTALTARRVHADLLADLDGASSPEAAADLLGRALLRPVASHADRRIADYVITLVLAHIAVLTLEGAARRAQLVGAQAVKDEIAPMALLRLALAAVLEEKAFWDPERRESHVTLRRWLQRWSVAVGEEEGVEVAPVLDSLGLH